MQHDSTKSGLPKPLVKTPPPNNNPPVRRYHEDEVAIHVRVKKVIMDLRKQVNITQWQTKLDSFFALAVPNLAEADMGLMKLPVNPGYKGFLHRNREMILMQMVSNMLAEFYQWVRTLDNPKFIPLLLELEAIEAGHFQKTVVIECKDKKPVQFAIMEKTAALKKKQEEHRLTDAKQVAKDMGVAVEPTDDSVAVQAKIDLAVKEQENAATESI